MRLRRKRSAVSTNPGWWMKRKASAMPCSFPANSRASTCRIVAEHLLGLSVGGMSDDLGFARDSRGEFGANCQKGSHREIARGNRRRLSESDVFTVHEAKRRQRGSDRGEHRSAPELTLDNEYGCSRKHDAG